MSKRISILGTRGVPARHGGFETFADHLARHLVANGWLVTVYCQVTGTGAAYVDEWRGVRRVNVPTSREGALGTVAFDIASTRIATRDAGIHLVLGYNTAFLNLVLRSTGKRLVMNMDGLEWQRSKWSAAQRAWLRANEFIGAKTAQHLIADHPRIADHLAALRDRAAITTIPYGSDTVEGGATGVPLSLGVEPGSYYLCVARIEPENSMLEIVTALAGDANARPVVVLGSFEPATNAYHARIAAAAGPNCHFPGPIYEPEAVASLRYHAFAYVHGHTVGGTNPSLVEAMGAGNAVVAHDNQFNRWVVGDGAAYFSDIESLRAAATRLESEGQLRSELSRRNRSRHAQSFTWQAVLSSYEALLDRVAAEVEARRRP